MHRRNLSSTIIALPSNWVEKEKKDTKRYSVIQVEK